MLQCQKNSATDISMRFSSHILQLLSICVLVLNTACHKASDEHVWDHYSASREDTGDTYIDNDEYYTPPTGGYVTGANGGILDAD